MYLPCWVIVNIILNNSCHVLSRIPDIQEVLHKRQHFISFPYRENTQLKTYRGTDTATALREPAKQK